MSEDKTIFHQPEVMEPPIMGDVKAIHPVWVAITILVAIGTLVVALAK